MKDISVMIDTVRLNYRVGLLIIKDNDVLVEISPVYGTSILPGGRVKTLESSIDTLVRELKEEMKIDISKDEVQLAGFLENFYNFNALNNHELFVVYKLIVKDNRFDNISVNYDSDTNYYKWVNKEELDKVNLLPREIKQLVDSNSFEHIIINGIK